MLELNSRLTGDKLLRMEVEEWIRDLIIEFI
jgi:hypothetical protein